MTAHRLAASLARGDSLFRGLLESAPDAIVIVDETGGIALINSQTERLFGYERSELLGKPVEILVPQRLHAVHAGHREAYFHEPRARGMGAGLDLYGRRKNGEEFPVEISLSPLQTGQGLLVSSAIRDVSERKRGERALSEKNIELQNANQAKDRFLASMSHELRTPLNAIIGFTGTLLMRLPGPLTDEQEHQLRTVRDSARHLLSLINDLLDLAKVESGTVHVEVGPVACQVVVNDVVETLRPLAEAKGLVVDVHMPAHVVLARADRRAFSQILINLTSNAIKFTDRGRVSIELVNPSSAGDLMIRVTDTGVGIRPEDQQKLFAAFSQVPSSSGRAEGTGLGLHLSQKLAQLMGGAIAFTSEFGQGSRFTLSLPRY